MTHDEAVELGRKGGEATAKRFGVNRFICPEFGCLCPRKLGEKSEYMSEIGRRGGINGAKVLAKRKGEGLSAHMSEIGKLGGRGNRKK